MATQNTDKQVCNIYQQRKTTAIHTTPLPRFDLVSPFPFFTKFQLDMRRKVEILKYDRQDSKAPVYTKKTNFSRIMQGYNKKLPIAETTIDCSANEYLPTPSYYSGIPGPPITLKLDPNVPLYNYTNDLAKNLSSQSELSILFKPNNIWEYYTKSNIICNQAIDTKIFTLRISDSIKKPYYIYSFNTPIGIYIDGSYNADSWFRYSVLNATLNVYYQGSIVQVNKTSYSSTLKTIPYNIDISFTYVNQYDISLSYPNYFQGCQFVGNLYFSNIFLYTQPGYVYDFYLNIVIGPKMINGTINTRFNPGKFYAICNFTNDLFINNNCKSRNSIPGISSIPISVSTTF